MTDAQLAAERAGKIRLERFLSLAEWVGERAADDYDP